MTLFKSSWHPICKAETLDFSAKTLTYTDESPTNKLVNNWNNHQTTSLTEFPLNWFFRWSFCFTIADILQFFTWNQHSGLFYKSFKIRIDLSCRTSLSNKLAPHCFQSHFLWFFNHSVKVSSWKVFKHSSSARSQRSLREHFYFPVQFLLKNSIGNSTMAFQKAVMNPRS